MSQITTHILDTSAGRPAAGIDVVLSHWEDNAWHDLAQGVTDADGRIGDWMDERLLAAGDYRLRFQTRQYFDGRGVETFYPHVEIVFTIAGDGQHYHVPLLLNPFGYSTYRGS